MMRRVRGLSIMLVLGACHVPDTNRPPDANTSIDFRLGLTTRYQQPAIALDGLSVWVDGKNHVVDGSNEVANVVYQSVETALEGRFTVEIRFGPTVLDRMVQSPGDLCATNRGDDNRLVSETVNLCLRSNGEIQVNDFSCEYEASGFYTADVFCPTDCHPLLGAQACEGARCGLVLTHRTPRFGVLACVPSGSLASGSPCREPEVGAVDGCDTGLACVRGQCRPFCVDGSDCSADQQCVSALSNDAEPFVCVGEDEAPQVGETER